MVWYLLILVIIIGIGLFLIYLKRQKQQTDTASLYVKQETPFTPLERSFLGVLDKGIGSHALVFGKVRVADVLEPKKGLSRSQHQSALNRIDHKHFDYVICDSKDLSVKCVIELNDKSPQNKKSGRGDAFLQEACNQAGIPMVQVSAKPGSQIKELRSLISRYLPKAPPPLLLKAPSRPPATHATKAGLTSKLCPRCGSVLVEATIKKGEHAGKKILACKSFPKCRYYEPIKSGN